MAGTIDWVFLSEDTDISMLRILAKHSGFSTDNTLFFSYKTSTNLESAKILAEFIREISPTTKVVIHRDRDFMNEAEVTKVSDKITSCGAIPFVTEGADVEDYFVHPRHIADRVGASPEDVEVWLTEIAVTYHNDIHYSFTRKRDEVKRLLYKDNSEACPGTLELIGTDIPLPVSKRRGKFMLKKVRGGLHERFDIEDDLLVATDGLKSPRLEEILNGIA